jgi:hypothetical protein
VDADSKNSIPSSAGVFGAVVSLSKVFFGIATVCFIFSDSGMMGAGDDGRRDDMPGRVSEFIYCPQQTSFKSRPRRSFQFRTRRTNRGVVLSVSLTSLHSFFARARSSPPDFPRAPRAQRSACGCMNCFIRTCCNTFDTQMGDIRGIIILMIFVRDQ